VVEILLKGKEKDKKGKDDRCRVEESKQNWKNEREREGKRKIKRLCSQGENG
jgi:hypothetical protein